MDYSPHLKHLRVPGWQSPDFGDRDEDDIPLDERAATLPPGVPRDLHHLAIYGLLRPAPIQRPAPVPGLPPGHRYPSSGVVSSVVQYTTVPPSGGGAPLA